MPDAPEMSVILCTAGYDHSIRFWEAWSGICHRQIALNQAWVSGCLYSWLLWVMKALVQWPVDITELCRVISRVLQSVLNYALQVEP